MLSYIRKTYANCEQIAPQLTFAANAVHVAYRRYVAIWHPEYRLLTLDTVDTQDDPARFEGIVAVTTAVGLHISCSRRFTFHLPGRTYQVLLHMQPRFAGMRPYDYGKQCERAFNHVPCDDISVVWQCQLTDERGNVLRSTVLGEPTPVFRGMWEVLEADYTYADLPELPEFADMLVDNSPTFEGMLCSLNG